VRRGLAAGLACAILAGCGSGGGIDDVRAKVDYDDSKPVKVEQLSQGPIFTEIEFQSPRGNDVTASIAMPRNRTGKVPAVLWAHASGSNRNQFATEVTELADRGIASIIYDSNMARFSRGGVDLQDPVYAAEVFELQLRQDIVDARVALDILERRGQVDMSRIGSTPWCSRPGSPSRAGPSRRTSYRPKASTASPSAWRRTIRSERSARTTNRSSSRTHGATA
jgi:hypothetical protein